MLLKSRNKDGIVQSKVAINCAGNRILIGSAFDSSVGIENSGAAYLYDDEGNLLHIFYSPSPRENDRFGAAVDINCSGDRVLIGASNTKTVGIIYDGAAYLYNGDTGCLLQSYTNPSLHDASERAFVSQIEDGFGKSVAISNDGTRVIISAASRSEKIVSEENQRKNKDRQGVIPGNSDVDLIRVNAGMVFVFNTDEKGELLQTLSAPPPAYDNEFFGRQIAINDDASVILIGIPGKKETFLYNEYGDIILKLNAPKSIIIGHKGTVDYNKRSYGFATAVNGDGTRLLVGAPGGASPDRDPYGEAYLYDNLGTLLQTYKSPGTANNGDTFGTSVSINYNGDRILIGAPYKDKSGSSFLFDSEGELLQTIVYSTYDQQPDPENSLGFGWFVAQDKYTTRAVIGSWWSPAIQLVCLDATSTCQNDPAIDKLNEQPAFDFVCDGSVHLSAAEKINTDPNPKLFSISIIFFFVLLTGLICGYVRLFHPSKRKTLPLGGHRRNKSGGKKGKYHHLYNAEEDNGIINRGLELTTIKK